MADSPSTQRSVADDNERDEDASEAQAQIIASLRAQVTDLFSQVTQLNTKLVSSYDRVSDLEDQLHDTSSSLRNASVTISSLELERSHHLAALNTGLLVEKAHVTAELNRLMERATEEAAQRGQAETARHDIEKELDDLSANLFDQANTMVAEARLNRAKSERKLQDAEQALKIAEGAVKDMQVQMQSLQAEKEAAEHDAQEAKQTMGKGKWAERDDVRVGEVLRLRFMTTHAPYAEFIAFVTHLRGLRVSQPTPPVVSTLLSQPFLARLLTEDSEPTVRLDLAPSLNWLSRRSVLAAIHAGMLTVEPLPFSSLIQELHQHPQSMTTSSLSCALCGTLIARLPSTTPVSRSQNTNGGSWFKYPLALSTSQNNNSGTTQSPECEPPGQVYVFRLAVATTSTLPSAPIPVHTSSVSMSAVGTSSRPPLNTITSSRVLQTQAQNSPHPLCTSNYCLARLRSTCSLWAFVRVGIVERIWEEEVVQPPKPAANGDTRETPSPTTAGNQPTSRMAASEKPPVPPRRRKLWEMASALGERAVSWSRESGENAKEKGKESEKEGGGAKKLPTPPPSHPSVPHPHAESPTSQVGAQGPPPLPKRDVSHGVAATDTAVPPPGTQNGIAVPETKEPTASAESPTDGDKTDPDTLVMADTVVPTSGTQNGIVALVMKEPTTVVEGPTDADKADPDTSNFSTPVDENTFVAPTSEASSPPSTTSLPAAGEPSAGPIQDHPQPPSPNTIPLPMTPTTPTPNSIPRVTSPAPRPRSRVSSPASPPPGSRPASPALNHSRTGSPAPSLMRAAPSSPGHAPSLSHIRGKMSMSSPLASSRSASPAPLTGPGAPPLPRRAAARRAVPPPPTPEGPKAVAEEGFKEEVASPTVATDPVLEADAHKVSEALPPTSDGPKVAEEGLQDEAASPAATAINPIPEVNARKAGEVDVPIEKQSSHGETEGEGVVDAAVNEATIPQDVSVPTPATAAAQGPAPDAASSDVKQAPGNVEGAANGTSAIAVSDSRASESDACISIHTTSTKQSSSTEGEGFASDATWEERTWKELVRLKEAMFWARIGEMRALEG